MTISKQLLSLTPFTLLNHASRILLTAVLARLMGQEHYGSFAALLVLGEVLLLPASLGFSVSLMRLAHPLERANNTALLAGLQRVYIASIATIGAAIIAIVLLGYALLSPQQLANEHLLYLLLIAPLGALVQTQSAFLVALKHRRLSLLTQQSLFELLTLLFCLALFQLNQTLPLPQVCQALTIALALVALYQFCRIQPLIRCRVKHYQTKDWYRQSLLLLASGAGTVLVAKLDVLLVHHWLGPEAVGVFFPAVVITALVMVVANAVITLLKPLLLEQHHSSNAATSTELLQLIRTFWLINTAVLLVLALLAKPLLTLYGETQLQLGYEVLLICLAGQIFLPLRIISSNIIKLTANPAYNLYILLFASAVTLLLAWQLQQSQQLIGIAIAFSFGFALGAVLRTILVICVLKVPAGLVIGFPQLKNDLKSKLS